MPVTINGRVLGVAQNGVFPKSVMEPIPGGQLWHEAALTWNAMEAAYVAAGGNPNDFRPGGPASSSRSLAQQRALKAQWTAAGHPEKAATPGTSNHGWGLAVDCPNARAQAWLMRHCAEYGWSHDEGLRVGEPWHYRYVGAAKALLRRLMRDPLVGYTASERRWIREYDALVRAGRDLPRRRVLRIVMRQQAGRIEVVARRSGWTRARRRRFASLDARSK